MRRDNNKFSINSSLGMVSVLNGATLDLPVSNLMVIFPDMQNECTYTQASTLVTSEKPYNSQQTK